MLGCEKTIFELIQQPEIKNTINEYDQETGNTPLQHVIYATINKSHLEQFIQNIEADVVVNRRVDLEQQIIKNYDFSLPNNSWLMIIDH